MTSRRTGSERWSSRIRRETCILGCSLDLSFIKQYQIDIVVLFSFFCRRVLHSSIFFAYSVSPSRWIYFIWWLSASINIFTPSQLNPFSPESSFNLLNRMLLMLGQRHLPIKNMASFLNLFSAGSNKEYKDANPATSSIGTSKYASLPHSLFYFYLHRTKPYQCLG